MPSTNTIPAANSHFISTATAIDLLSRFSANRDSVLQTGYQNQNLLPLSETFNLEDLNVLTGQEGCAAIRIYYGMDDTLKLHAVLVAVNAGNEDILPSATSLLDAEDIILEEGQRCPVICPPPSVLNS